MRINRAISCMVMVACISTFAADWPMFRHDVGRTAATAMDLPDELQLQWTLQLPEPRPAWQGERENFDSTYQPIVTGKTLLISSNVNDSVTAYDTGSGTRKWRFFCDGPVRLAPTAANGKVYFGSDDGFLYCLDAETGRLLWKYQGALTDRKVLGNQRIISSWPVRCGPVLSDGKIFISAGIFPSMCASRCQLDAETGKVKWRIDASGSLQGYATLLGNCLLAPSGRQQPGGYGWDTGKRIFRSILRSSRATPFLSGIGDLIVHRKHFSDLRNNERGMYFPAELRNAVLTPQKIYSVFATPTSKYCKFELAKQRCKAGDLIVIDTSEAYRLLAVPATTLVLTGQRASMSESMSMAKKFSADKKTFESKIEPIKLPMPLQTVWLKAASRLYASSRNGKQIVCIDMENGGKLAWTKNLSSSITGMLAADNRLFVMNKNAELLCFGSDEIKSPPRHKRPTLRKDISDGWTKKVKDLLSETGLRAGYALVLGIDNVRLLEEMALQSELHITAIDSDADKVATIRKALDEKGLYGRRVAVHTDDPLKYPVPPYISSLILLGKSPAEKVIHKPANLKDIFALLHPHGGMLLIEKTAGDDIYGTVKQQQLSNCRITPKEKYLVLTRGALPGEGAWTHQNATPGRILNSGDKLVKAPLGVLWFDDSSIKRKYPFTAHKTTFRPQVAGGKMLAHGSGILSVIDLYTGRFLWDRKLKQGSKPWTHGGAIVTLPDGIFIHDGIAVLKLNPDSGKSIFTTRITSADSAAGKATPGFIAVDKDIIIAGDKHVLTFRTGRKGQKYRINHPRSQRLVALDRNSGKQIWSIDAKGSFPHDAIVLGGGRLYVLDLPKPMLFVYDLKTGKELWSTEKNVFGKRLVYDEENDILLQLHWRGKKNQMKNDLIARRGATGKQLWHSQDGYSSAYVFKGKLLPNHYGYALDIGSGKLTDDWFEMKGHCGKPLLGENILTYRSGFSAYTDMRLPRTGKVTLAGFRSGCTGNLVPAGGILAAETRFADGCNCPLPIQCSVGFIHDPDIEAWSRVSPQDPSMKLQELSHHNIGINFAAPGTRMSESGTTWFKYAAIAEKKVGNPPAPFCVLTMLTMGKAKAFYRHSSRLTGKGLRWVAGSGVKGLESVTVSLKNKSSYTVRLYFMEPEFNQAGSRIFSLSLQDKTVLSNFDIFKDGGSRMQSVIKEFNGIAIDTSLRIKLTPLKGETLLCGIELINENSD